MTISVTHTTPADASFSATGAAAWNATHSFTGVLDVANGGTGTATPSLVAGTNVTITGTWPNQTINSSGGGGSGSVTSVSVTSANGLAGTVTNPTTTPAISLSTTVTGLLKGNGTAISAATSGTDYAPATSGTSILYGNGSGGFSNVTIGSGLSFTTGTLSATGGGGGTPGGSNTQVQFNNSGSFGGSANFTWDGTNVQLGTQGALRFADADSSNYVAFKSPATVATNVTWTLPNADGSYAQVLSTNGSGTLSWVTQSGGGGGSPNLDGGIPSSNYGGITAIDGGTP
jgi:hypothetical protein